MSKRPRLLPPRGSNAQALLICLALAALYTFARYAIFKGVSLQHWPVYLVNKAVSLAAVCLLAMSTLIRRWAWLKPSDSARELSMVRFCGLSGFWLAGVHFTLSLLIHSPQYFPELFDQGKLTFWGELAMLSGVLALWCFLLPAAVTLPGVRQAVAAAGSRRYYWVSYAGLLLVLVHVAAMGWPKWLAPSTWPGFLPPITLLAAVVVVLPLLARYLGKSSK